MSWRRSETREREREMKKRLYEGLLKEWLWFRQMHAPQISETEYANHRVCMDRVQSSISISIEVYILVNLGHIL